MIYLVISVFEFSIVTEAFFQMLGNFENIVFNDGIGI